MQRLFVSIALVALLGLSGCVTARYGNAPEAVPGRPDTFTFKIWPNAFVTSEAYVFEKLKPDLEQFRIEKGYRSFDVTERMCQPSGPCTYAVKFAK